MLQDLKIKEGKGTAIKPEKLIVVKRIIFLFILVVGIVEAIFVVKNHGDSPHLLVMFLVSSVMAVNAFIKRDDLKWCEFVFAIEYLFLTVFSVLVEKL